jgi:hypothetical protein
MDLAALSRDLVASLTLNVPGCPRELPLENPVLDFEGWAHAVLMEQTGLHHLPGHRLSCSGHKEY